MTKPKVYLCGPITGLTLEECTQERDRVINLLHERGIEGYSPMRGKKHLIKPGEVIGSGSYPQVIGRAAGIVGRDRNDVYRCDALLADLRGAKCASIGSMVEFGWADAWRKPIVTVMEEDNIHQHVFVTHLSTYVTPNMEDALDLLELLLTPSRAPATQVQMHIHQSKHSNGGKPSEEMHPDTLNALKAAAMKAAGSDQFKEAAKIKEAALQRDESGTNDTL